MRRVIVDTDDRHPGTSIIRISNNVERITLPEHPFFILCTSRLFPYRKEENMKSKIVSTVLEPVQKLISRIEQLIEI